MKPGIVRAVYLSLPLLASVLVLALWNPVGDFWGLVEPPKAQVEAYDAARLAKAKTLDSGIYSRVKLDRLLREPQNTVSNVAYVLVGLAVLFSARRRVSQSFGAACVFLGIGSGLYHASLLAEWRLIDILGVYATLFALVLCGVVAVVGHFRREGYTVPAVWVSAVFSGVHRNDYRIAGFKLLDSKTIVVFCVIVGCALALLCAVRIGKRRQLGWLAGLLALSAVTAFYGGIADRFGGGLANPEYWVQGHTVWHVMGALALLATYEVYAMTGFDRSVLAVAERPKPPLETPPEAIGARTDAGVGAMSAVPRR